MRIQLILLPFFLLLSSFVFAQAVELDRIKGEVRFDGKLEESWWKEMRQYKTVQVIPDANTNPVEKDEIYVGYDSDYIYVAARIEAKNMSDASKKRDEFSLQPDYIGIMLDSYKDGENALGFFTTPSGLRTDFAVFEDAVGDFPINLDWNTYWDVKTEKGADFWTVEMRIPFSSLKFQVDENGVADMGLIVWRANAYYSEFSTWPYIPNNWGGWSTFKPSQAQHVRFKGVKNTNPIYITPYTLAGYSRSFDANSSPQTEENSVFTGGLDVKYNITSNITADLTFNTDFAQVEVDDAQVNLTRFNLFFPEKRQFFQERAAIFDLRVGGPNRVFYSRRIGIDENGNLENILGGGRVTGRLGKYDVGVINMTTREGNSWTPNTNFTVARLRRQVLNKQSYVGVLATHKTDFDGGYNSVYALDGTLRLAGNNIFQVRLAQSLTDGYENNLLSLDPTRFIINLEKFQFNGFTYDLAVGRRGKDYNPEMGFESRTDFTSVFAILGYGWQAKETSKLMQHSIKMYNFGFHKNTQQEWETVNCGISYDAQWRRGHGFNVFSYLRYERLFSPIEIVEGVTVDDGSYLINVVSSSFNNPGSAPVQYRVELRGGDFFDSKFASLTTEVSRFLTSDFSLGLFYNYNPIFIDGWSSGDVKNVHLARLRFLYTFSTKMSLNGFFQGTSEGSVGLGNFRMRYNPREGVDLFIVYNNVLGLDRFSEFEFREIPQQSLVAKFSYTFSTSFGGR